MGDEEDGAGDGDPAEILAESVSTLSVFIIGVGERGEVLLASC